MCIQVIVLSGFLTFLNPLSNEDIIGKWLYEGEQSSVVIDLKYNGTFKIDEQNDHTIDGRGTYNVSNDQVTFKSSKRGNEQCIDKAAVFKFVIDSGKMTITKVSDKCEHSTMPDGASITLTHL